MKTASTKLSKNRRSTLTGIKEQGAAVSVSRTARRKPKVSDIAPPTPVVAKPAPLPTRKKSLIEAMVRRREGCTVSELTAATGWQEHSLRAAITGLRKAGHSIDRDKTDGPSRYRIVEVT